MVNEINKPQESLENEQLGQRLTASNQALANMQAEHRQLLEEMEELKRRAENLQRIREQQEREEEENRLGYQRNLIAKEETLCSEEGAKSSEVREVREETSDKGSSEEADYIKEKLAEIARLKAQFKRVQHMINTTELIDDHISKHQAGEILLNKESAAYPVAETETEVNSKKCTILCMPTAVATDPELVSMPKMPSMADLNAATTSDEKEQLILTMLNMFQDFSTDLKSQADNLRAERERIRELKESIISSRKEQRK